MAKKKTSATPRRKASKKKTTTRRASTSRAKTTTSRRKAAVADDAPPVEEAPAETSPPRAESEVPPEAPADSAGPPPPRRRLRRRTTRRASDEESPVAAGDQDESPPAERTPAPGPDAPERDSHDRDSRDRDSHDRDSSDERRDERPPRERSSRSQDDRRGSRRSTQSRSRSRGGGRRGGDDGPSQSNAHEAPPVRRAPLVPVEHNAEPMRAMGAGSPPPFVVARGDDTLKVLDEALKYTGFFERLEAVLDESEKPREEFTIVAKVDLMDAERKEEHPASYVDPKLIRHLFDQLLDRGFRLLRVVDTRGELSRYQQKRDIKSVGNTIGYDETCYDLFDLADQLVPTTVGALGKVPMGREWVEADFRLVVAKNGTDELLGPDLVLSSIFRTLAVPSSLIAIERGVDPATFVQTVLQDLPVHFALIDAVVSRDGPPGTGGLYDLLQGAEGEEMPEHADLLQTNTIIAGHDPLAVEAAGQKMQGLDPLEDEVFKLLRRNIRYQPPAEIADLPMHTGWRGIGRMIREALGETKPKEILQFALQQKLQAIDRRAFPALQGGWQHVRLREHVATKLEELRREAEADAVDSSDEVPGPY